jgi:hypothetical protein
VEIGSEVDHYDSQIMAHEMGHNLGMDHDFNGSPGVTRYDSKGVSCTNIGGVMDYYQVIHELLKSSFSIRGTWITLKQ